MSWRASNINGGLPRHAVRSAVAADWPDQRQARGWPHVPPGALRPARIIITAHARGMAASRLVIIASKELSEFALKLLRLNRRNSSARLRRPSKYIRRLDARRRL